MSATQAWALLGSGEFDPWTDEVDRRMLVRDGARPGRVLVAPTASAAEGDGVFDHWAAKGLAHYAGRGIPAQVVALKTRDDAHRQDLVSMLDEASMIFFSGGNPAYLASVLADTPFWTALRGAMAHGMGYGGCSAGVASLGDTAPDSARESIDDELWQPGLGVFPGTWFGPHWDTLDGFAPGLTGFMESSVPEGSRLIGIDEDTAMVGDCTRWEVVGTGGVHVLERGSWTRHGTGEAFALALTPVSPEPGAG
ncbi:MAG TPA: Type 1 glutamine amidotransferase-like domain-containing protein [Actinomycetota bacterium]